MKEFQQAHFFHKMIYSKVTIVILGALILILLRSTVGLYEKRNDVVVERNKKEEELKDAERQLSDTKEKKTFLESERGKEEYIRTTFPVVKEGEGVIIVYDDKKESVRQVKKELSTKESLKRFLKDLFGSDR